MSIIHVPVLVIEDQKSMVEKLDIISKKALELLGISKSIQLRFDLMSDVAAGERPAGAGTFPMAIIDLALPDPRAGASRDVHKYAGLNLIASVKRSNKDTAVAVFTTYSADTVNDLIRLHIDVLLDKQAPDADLIRAFADLTSIALSRFNYAIDVKTAECLSIAFSSRSTDIKDLPNWDVCIRRYMRTAKEAIEYDRVGGGRSGAGIVAAYVDNALPVILKLNNYAQLEDEMSRYERFVKPYISRRASTSNDDLAQSGSLGCLTYSFVGLTEMPTTLGDAIERGATLELLSAAVVSHFNVNCKRWLAGPTLEKPYDLAADLVRRYEIDSTKMISRERPPSLESAIMRAARFLDCSPTTLIETIRVGLETRYSKVHVKPDVTLHGDLNVHNLIWDGSELWMIDFAKTGPGPRLLDFVKLEASVKYDISSKISGSSDEDVIADILALEVAAIGSLPLSTMKQCSGIILRKHTIIEAIRDSAAAHVGSSERYDYWMSLFFVTVKHLRYLANDVLRDASKHVPLTQAITSAYLLAKRLESLSD